MLGGTSQKWAVVGGISLSVIFGIGQPAAAARFRMDIAYTQADLLPPWDLPETGSGFFEFDGATYGEFIITSLIFQNYETFPGTPLFPNGQTEPYPLNTESLLTPIVFAPDTFLISTPTRLSALGSLDFQTSVGRERCRTDPIARGGALCNAFVPSPLVQLDLSFDNPIFDGDTDQFFASNFSWSLTATTAFEIPDLRFPVPAGSTIGAGVNVDVLNPFPGDIGPEVIPANRATPIAASSIPEPGSIFGLLIATGASIGLKRKRQQT
ncbi:MAG: PEP-CTERM sorting domain-containing protein [Leptolyngbyaceae cyanobacterium MO_188.B28]|nr:PEP-CTERM sorting domain-containing protein [Leptolyngbyaceae cyanobacterium MO_188.B28]